MTPDVWQAAAGRLAGPLHREPPAVSEGVIEHGVLVMARQGVRMDAAAAVQADRDALADRSLPR